MREAVAPTKKQDLEPEERSFGGQPDYRPYRKCLEYNTGECREADTGGYCGNPDFPLLHACDRVMVDGSHCSRPHPHFTHEVYVAKERQARVQAGYEENRCWDPTYDLHYGKIEENDLRIAVPAQPWTKKHLGMDRQCEEFLDKWFTAKESGLARVTFQGDRGVVYERYLQDRDEGRAWTPLFINLSGEDFNQQQALDDTLQATLTGTATRMFLPGGEYIPNTNGDAIRFPERGTRPGGFCPQNQAALENALAEQRREKVNILFLFLSFSQ